MLCFEITKFPMGYLEYTGPQTHKWVMLPYQNQHSRFNGTVKIFIEVITTDYVSHSHGHFSQFILRCSKWTWKPHELNEQSLRTKFDILELTVLLEFSFGHVFQECWPKSIIGQFRRLKCKTHIEASIHEPTIYSSLIWPFQSYEIVRILFWGCLLMFCSKIKFVRYKAFWNMKTCTIP